MKPIRHIPLLLYGILLLVLLAGCGSPASGTWKFPDTGVGALTLLMDGTGQINMPPETGPIKWSEDGSTVKIFQPTDDPKTAVPMMTGTLSGDKKSLNLAAAGAGMTANLTLTR